MWFKRLISPSCCGGTVLALVLLCLSVGILFLTVSALIPGLMFIFTGIMAEAICLYMSRTHCIDNYNRKWQRN